MNSENTSFEGFSPPKIAKVKTEQDEANLAKAEAKRARKLAYNVRVNYKA